MVNEETWKNMMKLCIIGLGNVGTALFNGLSASYSLILIGKNDHIKVRHSSIKNSDIILLCVRTNQVDEFFLQNSASLTGKTVVFFQAGFSLSNVDKYRDSDLVFIRAITNINVASKNGYTVLLKSEFDKEYESILNLLKSVGDVKEVQTEDELESVALLPGCSPAIVALIVHYLEGITIKYGIDINSNKEAIFAAVSGTIATIRLSGSPSLEIAKSVASPGGKVEKALAEVIDSQNLEQVLTKYFDEITKH